MKRVQPKALAKKIIRAVWDKKAEQIALLNLKKLSGVADYFVICSAGSEMHAQVIAEAVRETFRGTDTILHVEGSEHGRWILVDCLDVVLHIFRPETREYYALEKLWGDAPREDYPDDTRP